jgi:tetratricopeptide (TPR) repeat protein
VVLKAAYDKLIKDAAKDPEAAKKVAGVQQTSGEVHMALGQWAEAAWSFNAAISYWQDKKVLPVVLTELSKQYVDALLRAGNYAEAADFAAKRIAADPQAQGDMGFRIRSEVERLMKSDKPDDLKSALQLIDEAEKMQPPLSSAYSDQLKQYRDEIHQRNASSEKPGK